MCAKPTPKFFFYLKLIWNLDYFIAMFYASIVGYYWYISSMVLHGSLCPCSDPWYIVGVNIKPIIPCVGTSIFRALVTISILRWLCTSCTVQYFSRTWPLGLCYMYQKASFVFLLGFLFVYFNFEKVISEIFPKLCETCEGKEQGCLQ